LPTPSKQWLNYFNYPAKAIAQLLKKRLYRKRKLCYNLLVLEDKPGKIIMTMRPDYSRPSERGAISIVCFFGNKSR
jgi:hypothetical protein